MCKRWKVLVLLTLALLAGGSYQWSRMHARGYE
jgi:hypothetical protein